MIRNNWGPFLDKQNNFSHGAWHLSSGLHKPYPQRTARPLDHLSQPKKAIMFAAGFGSRLGAYTRNLPKTLLPIGDLSIFDRMVIGLDKIGISDIAIVTGYAGQRLRSHALSFSTKMVQNRVKFEFIVNDNLDKGNIYSFWLA